MVLGVVSVLFYDSLLAFWLFLLPCVYVYLKKKRKTLCERRKQLLSEQFREVILAASSHIQAGLSIENAFGEAHRDIQMLYGEDSLMAQELAWLLRRINNNEALEQVLLELGKRSGVGDIREFAEIFAIAKRGGGELRGMITKTAVIIGDKMEIRREMDTIMSEKKLEQRIMQCMPFALIGYLTLTSPGLLDSLYHNLVGVLLMTGCLGVYVLAYYLSDKILDIAI